MQWNKAYLNLCILIFSHELLFLVKIAVNDLENLMVQLIKKGGLRERANRSRRYKGSENTEATLKPNRYVQPQKNEQVTSPASLSIPVTDETASK